MKFSPVAILYQAVRSPLIDGIRKPPNPRRHKDSGADIAWTLKNAGIPVITPEKNPDPASDLDWVFPDTVEGIKAAIALAQSSFFKVPSIAA